MRSEVRGWRDKDGEVAWRFQKDKYTVAFIVSTERFEF
jgi:hypothetical protein